METVVLVVSATIPSLHLHVIPLAKHVGLHGHVVAFPLRRVDVLIPQHAVGFVQHDHQGSLRQTLTGQGAGRAAQHHGHDGVFVSLPARPMLLDGIPEVHVGDAVARDEHKVGFDNVLLVDTAKGFSYRHAVGGDDGPHLWWCAQGLCTTRHTVYLYCNAWYLHAAVVQLYLGIV